MTTFDAHALLGCDRWLAENKPELAHCANAAWLAATLDEATGCSDWVAAVMPFPSAAEPSYAAENQAVVDAARDDPRFVPVAVANPRNEANLDQLRGFAEAKAIAGLQIWPILCDLDLGEVAGNDLLWDFAAEFDLPVTIHVATGDEPSYRDEIAINAYGPIEAVRIAQRRPEVRFNLSHALRLSRPALTIAAGLDNVWTDLSGYSSFGRWLEQGKETFPASHPIVGPDDLTTLAEVLIAEFGFTGRIMFASSEPFCRWWGASAASELAAANAIGNSPPTDAMAHAAFALYRNWFDRKKDSQ